MIVLVSEIKEVQHGEYTNLEVKGQNIKTQKDTNQIVYSTLKEKWPLVQPNKMVELVMKNHGTKETPKWQVDDIKPVDAQPAPPQEAKPVPAGNPPEHLVKEAIKQGAQVISSTDDTKLRSMAIAYAKDLACAGKTEVKDITTYANKFLDYILNITRKE